jgi:hypothetical protein
LVDGLFAPPSGYNEMIVSQPEITAFFREYLPSDNRFDNRLLEAAKRGLPIVLWGKKDGSIY